MNRTLYCDCILEWQRGRARREGAVLQSPCTEPRLHLEEQDTRSRAWGRLIELIETSAADGREEFSPAHELREDWAQILTLPATISKLKRVKHLNLYGSRLVRIPPEIGEMTDLREFTPYTSYSLHWFPYEITRCRKLKESTVSTRALYGNWKFRSPFPRLPSPADSITPAACSLCAGPFDSSGPQQWWTSLRVATDVLPLLVHACSEECVRRLPRSPEGYVQSPHRGGLNLQQPETD
jgi:hypothetical protein